jgi:OOP family OmpA-OmpF porin
MTKRFNPMQSLGAATIAAAFAALSGAAGAQPGSSGGPGLPGYVVSSDGRPVLSGFGHCVRNGFWTQGNAAEPCDRIARADLPPPPVAAAPPPPTPAPAPVIVPPPRPVIQKLTLSTDVLFDFNKAELKDSGKARLDQLAAEIKDADVDEIIAVGHADRIASEEYNQKLSEQRAQAVKDYLSQQGAKAKTITAEGKGESEPVTGEDCKKLGAERAANKKLVACLQPDRRVEIEVLGSREVAAGGVSPAGTGATTTPGTGATGR